MSDTAEAPGDFEEKLRPSGALLEAQTVLGRAIELFAVAKTGHDPTTLDLLVRLQLAPGRSLRGVDLCRQLLKSPSHISRILDRAEGAGLVRRRADPADRRAQRISLTRNGERVLDEFMPPLTDVLDATIYATLSANEIEALTNTLRRIADAAHALITGSPSLGGREGVTQ